MSRRQKKTVKKMSILRNSKVEHSYQKFKCVAKFDSNEELEDYIKHHGQWIKMVTVKSQLANCVLCKRRVESHRMRIKYMDCKNVDCRNSGVCYKISSCLNRSRIFLYESNYHLTHDADVSENVLDSNLKFLNEQESSLDIRGNFSFINNLENCHPIHKRYSGHLDSNSADEVPIKKQRANSTNAFDELTVKDELNMLNFDLLKIDDNDSASNKEFKESSSKRFLGLNVLPSYKLSICKQPVKRKQLQFNRIVFGEKLSKKLVWKTEDGSTIIYKDKDDKWHEFEMDENITIYEYKELYKTDDEVVLLNLMPTVRHSYIKLASEFVFFGDEPSKVDEVFNDGNWIEFISWKSEDENICFEKVDESRWQKCVKGSLLNDEYSFIKAVGDKVLLKNEQIFLELTNRDLFIGPSLENLTRECDGGWSKFNKLRFSIDYTFLFDLS